jgi:hypothetical protein
MAKIHGNTKVKTLRKIGIPVKGKHGNTTVGTIKKKKKKR